METTLNIPALERSIGNTTGEISSRIGALDFELGVPTSQTASMLYDEMDFQRAVQCYPSTSRLGNSN